MNNNNGDKFLRRFVINKTPNNNNNVTVTPATQLKIEPKMKKYLIELFEWEKVYDKNINRRTTIVMGEGRINKHNLTYEIPLNEQKKFVDIKNFIKDEFIKNENPICPCFLKVYKEVNTVPKNTAEELNDDNIIDDKVYNEKNPIYVGIVKKQCTCGKIEMYKNIVAINKIHKEELNKIKEESNKNKAQQDKIINKLENKIYNMEREKSEEIERKNYANLCFYKLNGKVIKQFFEENTEDILSKFDEIKNIINDKISFRKVDISKLLESENFSENVKSYLKTNFDEVNNNETISQISHFNILVMGETGAGKSTLLNMVLKKELAETQFGKPCTMEIRSYESPNVPGLRIYDTRGIEKGEYNIYKVKEDIKNQILYLISQNNPDEYIHCIWYCIKAGNRFEPGDFHNICSCYETYKTQKLPIIIIFTQANEFNVANKIVKEAQERFNEVPHINRENIKIKKILAKDQEHNFSMDKAYGIYDLMEETCLCVKKGIKSSLYESFKENIKKNLSEQFKKIILRFKSDYFENNNLNYAEAPRYDENNYENYIKLKPGFYYIYDQYIYYDSNIDRFYKNGLIIPLSFKDKENLKKDILSSTPYKSNTPESFSNNDIIDKNHNLLNENIKYTKKKFIEYVKNFCQKISLDLIAINHSVEGKVNNSLSFKELFDYIEKVIKAVESIFEDIFKNNLDSLSEKLAKKLNDLITKIGVRSGCGNYLAGEYNHYRLNDIARSNIEKYYMPIIKSKVFENINEHLFYKFANDFSSKLINQIDDLITNNKDINQVFMKKLKETTDNIYNNIKENIEYENDDFENVYSNEINNYNYKNNQPQNNCNQSFKLNISKISNKSKNSNQKCMNKQNNNNNHNNSKKSNSKKNFQKDNYNKSFQIEKNQMNYFFNDFDDDDEGEE